MGQRTSGLSDVRIYEAMGSRRKNAIIASYSSGWRLFMISGLSKKFSTANAKNSAGFVAA
jgi:hypothetical protein